MQPSLTQLIKRIEAIEYDIRASQPTKVIVLRDGKMVCHLNNEYLAHNPNQDVVIIVRGV